MKTTYEKTIEEVFEVKNPKPCPFCGFACPAFVKSAPRSYQVLCMNCDASSGYAVTPQMAYTLWEMRGKCTCGYCAAVSSFRIDGKDE